MNSGECEAEIIALAPSQVVAGGGFAVVRRQFCGGPVASHLALAEVSSAATLGSTVRSDPERLIPVSRLIDADLSVCIPILAVSMATWANLELELGEAAVVLGDDVRLCRWLALAAQWFGGMPVVASTAQNADMYEGLARAVYSDSPDALVQSIRDDTHGRAGWAGVECTGRPEMLEVMLDSVPKWGRIALDGRSSRPATIDFYNNVHRKGVRVFGLELETTSVFDATPGSRVRAFANRAASMLAHPALAARCRELIGPPVRHG